MVASDQQILRAPRRRSDRPILYRKSGKFAALPVFWEAAATGVEISVDEETGKITMEKLATVGDVGLAINPALAEGQDIGAATMGMGSVCSKSLFTKDRN